MPKFRSVALAALKELAVNDNAASHTSAECHSYDNRCSFAGSRNRFSEREAVRVVVCKAWQTCTFEECLLDGNALTTGDIGECEDGAFGVGDESRGTDTHSTRIFFLEFCYNVYEGIQHMAKALGCFCFPAQRLLLFPGSS